LAQGNRKMRTLAQAILVVWSLLNLDVDAYAIDVSASNSRSAAATRPSYPLKVSANNRYLVDRNRTPFLMVGDSPQNLIGKLSEGEAETYIASRATYGINALWINLLCSEAMGCSPGEKTPDGIAPFLVAGDLSTPDPAYFQRAENMIRLADSHGMVVILDPIE